MKTYNRATKKLTSEAWQSKRADFSIQAKEAYNNMNQQEAAKKS